jgi:hypothetical protein
MELDLNELHKQAVQALERAGQAYHEARGRLLLIEEFIQRAQQPTITTSDDNTEGATP